jgi:hypothetical protein
MRTMVNKPNYKEESLFIAGAFKKFEQQQIDKGFELLHRAIKVEKHPSAYMMFATYYLSGMGTYLEQNYASSEEFLLNALTYGIVDGKFSTGSLLFSFFNYLEDLLTESHPSLNKQQLLSSIKKKLTEKNIDLSALCTIIYQKTNINLETTPEWNGLKFAENPTDLVNFFFPSNEVKK